ncbi:P-loop containing nucleoside triphosphate hydrolase protein [Rickenella mellea]|uniref:P-loop containing nucleoside triphosphate hydrolase protein n=1 Tax=Rickenella mellea TaxID=50990 RepID=A0A4R5XG97_9AGAM|nr:P-loop containing nucleoside triphosphate hydrolase protein [Rickenella mellea]
MHCSVKMSTFLQAIAEQDIDIPDHIDIYLVCREAEPAVINAVGFIRESAKKSVAKIEKRIEDLEMAESVDEMVLEAAYEEPEEMEPNTFEAKAGSILHEPMDSVCTTIMELTPKKKTVYYKGNYTTFVHTKIENEVNQMKACIPSTGTYANLVKQAKSKQKIIDKMDAAGLIENVEMQRPLRFNFEKADSLYENLSFGIDMDSRIAILGANGTGKSTLLNLIMGLLQPSSGAISKHTSVKLVKYLQHSTNQLPYERSPIEYFDGLYPDKDVMAWLAQLGSEAGVWCPHSSRWTIPHILLLDEPTNHLDMTSFDALTRAIKEFEGGVVIVSHNFRSYPILSPSCSPLFTLTFSFTAFAICGAIIALILQVSEKPWDVKDMKNCNLTCKDITTVNYKKLLVKQSSFLRLLPFKL